jgi:hypothetical protein
MDARQIIDQSIRAWNSDDPSERRRLIEASCANDIEVVSPYGEHRGIAAHLEEIDHVRSQFPRAKCAAKVLGQHHGWVIDAWTTELGDGQAPLHGVDVTLVNETGRIVKVISFSPLPKI